MPRASDKNKTCSCVNSNFLFKISATGTPDEKLRLFFDMYDISGDQKLGRDEFKQMIK